MRLMKYYFAGSPDYQKLLDKINRKKADVDELVITLLQIPYVPSSRKKDNTQPPLAGNAK